LTFGDACRAPARVALGAPAIRMMQPPTDDANP
jgi:hypothetical protein